MLKSNVACTPPAVPCIVHAMSTRRFAGLAATLAAALTVGACGSSPERTCSDGATLTVCAAGPVVHGVDVSVYQGTIDWKKAANAGIAFGFARISDGLHSPDAMFATNWPAMKQAGVLRGAYQFFRPAQDPVAQADMAIAALAAAGPIAPGDLPLVLDMEVVDGVATDTIRQNMQAWLDRVEQGTGRAPILYTAPFMSATVGNGFTKYTLWVANYQVTCPTMPAAWTKWAFWQRSSSGSVDGIPSSVDLDDFNGTLADLIAFAHPLADAGVDSGAETGADAGAADAGAPGAEGAGATDAEGASLPDAAIPPASSPPDAAALSPCR